MISGCEVAKMEKYLGINVTGKNVELFKFKLLLLGRIAAIKMSVLPKVLFLFQTLPIINKPEILEKWQKTLLDFVWSGKKPRIKMKSLCDLRENGGLQIPNFRIYFEAVCFLWLRDWILLEDDKLLKLVGFDLSYGWHTYLAYKTDKNDKIFNCHLIRRVLFKVWSKYQNYYGRKKPLWIVPLEVLKQNVDYSEDMKLRYEDLLKLQEGTLILKDEQTLKEKVGWWYLLQIRNLFLQDKRKGGIMNQYLDIDKTLLGGKIK